ncbi:hypothetical protein DL766_000032 [Monosporascus sp. MC13-8B]|uniref:General stress protein FMN-binding split barrel domain-containing protein n=1 Tax=Monosporascus cannonballus TaxID=155416 RepID=A0ABY0HKR3_9PEZI|nr:hypothetical protein DL762_000401 [Monosporascus cannonballus]RYP01195.1 hypothetical protein DL763_000320 [Monosporascus cannonballus]RYP40231.1 hypothetical protein DL766_000032 [Monosporascus sp. MC13-8B]
MSSSFSNADTGNKPADPYKAESKDETSLADKIEVLVNFISSCKFGMMTTRDPSSNKLVSRCMAIAAKESGGVDLLFFTNTESHKTDELSADPHVNISFLDSSGQWASVSGTATIETDRNLVRQHYSPSLKAVIRVKTGSVTYIVTDKMLLGRVSEIAKGTVTGSVATPNKLRAVSESEVSEWRASH